MKSIIVIVAFLAHICSATSATNNEARTELFKLNLTSLGRWLNSDKNELTRQFNQLGVADEIGGILVVVAEIILVLTVLLLWGIFAFLAAFVTVGGSLLDALLSVITTSIPEVLDFVEDWVYAILPPVVNPMLDEVDMPKLAKLLDQTLPWSKAVILAAVLVVVLSILVVAIFGMTIFILLKVRNSSMRCCCGGKECKQSVKDSSSNNND